MQFAQFLKGQRISQNLTMRRFAEEKGYDVGYISRLENGVMKPPAEREKMEALASALNLKPETKEWVTFFDLAAAARKELPLDIQEDIHAVKILPAFYRTLRKKNVDRAEVDRLLEFIRKESGNGESNR